MCLVSNAEASEMWRLCLSDIPTVGNWQQLQSIDKIHDENRKKSVSPSKYPREIKSIPISVKATRISEIIGQFEVVCARKVI